jgi:hypothetical protein
VKIAPSFKVLFRPHFEGNISNGLEFCSTINTRQLDVCVHQDISHLMCQWTATKTCLPYHKRTCQAGVRLGLGVQNRDFPGHCMMLPALSWQLPLLSLDLTDSDGNKCQCLVKGEIGHLHPINWLCAIVCAQHYSQVTIVHREVELCEVTSKVPVTQRRHELY